MIREQLLSKLPWIKENTLEKEPQNSQKICVVSSRGLDPSQVRTPFEKELRRYCAQGRTMVPEIVSYAGP